MQILTWLHLIKEWIECNPSLTAAIVTFIVLTGTLIAMVKQIVAMRKARESQLLMGLGHYWDIELAASRDEISKTILAGKNLEAEINLYQTQDVKKYILLIQVLNFFEDLGWLVEKRYIRNHKLATEIFGNAATYYFKYYKQCINNSKSTPAPKPKDIGYYFGKFVSRIK